MVILVDERDRQAGQMQKLDAHREGLLHRAISVFIFNSDGEMLIQRRALSKYHSPGLWANACCSHPLPGEEVSGAAARRLEDELGIRCDLTYRAHFTYKADVGGGLTEYEYDHIFTGISDTTPLPDPDEVMNYKYIPIPDLLDDISKNPEKYAIWFRLILSHFPGEIWQWREKK